MKHDIRLKIEAMQAYLNEHSLAKVAARYSIHPVTLCRWMRFYKGNDGGVYKRHWARPEEHTEEKIMRLKEMNPALTINQAGRILEKQGISMTGKTIYNIWKRYNLINRPHDELCSPFGRDAPEVKSKMEYVRFLLNGENEKDRPRPDDNGVLKAAARIVNRLPAVPRLYQDVLTRIPENRLNLRRRLERLYAQWAAMPAPEYLKKIQRLRMALEKRRYFYSSMIAGVMELITLHRMRNPRQELKLNAVLKKRKGGLRDAGLNFALTFLAGTAYAEKTEIRKALLCARSCKRILSSLSYSVFIESYGDLMTLLTDYNEAVCYYRKSMEKAADGDTVRRLSLKISSSCVLAGQYRKAFEFLNRVEWAYGVDHYELYCLCRALANLGVGNIDEALSITQKTLDRVEVKQFRNAIYAASFCLAAIDQLLGYTKRGKDILKKYLPLLRKYGLAREAKVLKYLLYPGQMEKRLKDLPSFRLLYLLDRARQRSTLKNYRMVLNYAREKGLTGFLHRVLIFKSEQANELLNLGLDAKMPKSLLRLPIFNKTMPVYHVRFLGNLIVLKNQKYCRARLSPMEKAFLIHLALKAGEPGKSFKVQDAYQNFWRRSAQPAGQFSHLLVRIRKELMIPRHLLELLWGGEKRLFNQGVHFGTDYRDFRIMVTQAKALERAGEWGFARKEYLRAFKLFRGEPFKGMYDQWSDDLRHEILTELETATHAFAKGCLDHNDGNTAGEILSKYAKLVPYPDDLKDAVQRSL